ncbi:MAG: hypothetical protein WB689_12430 [Xanthobacteraceae bacterium]
MASLKTLTIAAALIAGATSPVLAQSGPPTGGQPPGGRWCCGERANRRHRRHCGQGDSKEDVETCQEGPSKAHVNGSPIRQLSAADLETLGPGVGWGPFVF